MVLLAAEHGSRQRYTVSTSLGGWMEVSFLGKLSGYDDHPLLLNWLLCYRPMALLLDFRRLVLLIGGCIASTAWFVSHAGLHGGRVVVLERKTKISSVQNWLTDWAWQRYGRGWDGSARRSFYASGVRTGGSETGRCSFGYGKVGRLLIAF